MKASLHRALFTSLLKNREIQRVSPLCFLLSIPALFSVCHCIIFCKNLWLFVLFPDDWPRVYPGHLAIWLLYFCWCSIFFTRLRSRRVVMCLVVVYVRSFVRSLIESRVFNIFWPNLKYRKKKVPRRF